MVFNCSGVEFIMTFGSGILVSSVWPVDLRAIRIYILLCSFWYNKISMFSNAQSSKFSYILKQMVILIRQYISSCLKDIVRFSRITKNVSRSDMNSLLKGPKTVESMISWKTKERKTQRIIFFWWKWPMEKELKSHHSPF